MNKTLTTLTMYSTTAAMALMLAACAMSPATPPGASAVRSKLTQLQSDPQLATRAPVAFRDAENAVNEAEQPQKDPETGAHLVYMADHKIDIAAARAQARRLEEQRDLINEQRQRARLDSRTREADRARLDTLAAEQQNDELQRQVAALNAKATERGLVLTLGDLLFATGRAELVDGADAHLNKLASFLNEHRERNVIIEGHTDNVGSDDYNLGLSQRRAQSVKLYLVGQGVDASRITTVGKGEQSPVADNGSVRGREKNRRVEVIISNMVTSTR